MTSPAEQRTTSFYFESTDKLATPSLQGASFTAKIVLARKLAYPAHLKKKKARVVKRFVVGRVFSLSKSASDFLKTVSGVCVRLFLFIYFRNCRCRS